jgi:hypothetical protein
MFSKAKFNIQNYIQEEIKITVNSGNDRHSSFQYRSVIPPTSYYLKI